MEKFKMTVTKADLVNKVHAANQELTKTKAHEAMETILEIIKSNLENGEDVLLSGFGKFNVMNKSSRRGRNPKTGETMILDARRVVTFKPSARFRQKVNGG